jgi:Flp pilus assembly pilin Flp
MTSSLRKFHEDESGLEALQVVMIIAIAAMVLVLVARLGNEVVDWMKQKWRALKGTSIG